MRQALFVLAIGLALSMGCGRRTSSCREACPCKNQGLCVGRGDACVAALDEDCKASDSCKALGRCTLHGEQCVVASDADCRASTWCTKLGQCRAQPNGGGMQCVR